MSKIVDILTPRIYECNYFTVNTGGPLSVRIQAAAPNLIMKLRSGYNGGLNTYFRRGNNFRITKIGYKISDPFHLCTENVEAGGTTQVNYEIYAYRNTFADYKILTLGEYIPMANTQFDADVFVDVEDDIKDVFYLGMKLQSMPAVDMVGVNAAYNGKKFWMWPFLQIECNEVLQRYP